MKGKEKKNLAEKVREKIDLLRTVHAEAGDIAVGIEVQQNLEKTLDAYMLAESRQQSAKKEHEMAKANKAVVATELRAAHKKLKKLLKNKTKPKKAGGKKQKQKSE